MANEISLNVNVSVIKGGINLNRALSGQFDMSGSHFSVNVQNIGTSAEALITNDVATPGMILIRNTDATNYVEIGTGTTTFVPFGKLLPVGTANTGGFSLFYASTTALTARAHTAACDVECWTIEA